MKNILLLVAVVTFIIICGCRTEYDTPWNSDFGDDVDMFESNSNKVEQTIQVDENISNKTN